MVMDYWTPERMASAKTMGLLPIDATNDFETVNRSLNTADSEHASRQLNIPGVPSKSLTASSSVVGMLFVHLGTSDYGCTASVIVSENGDTLFTAGQCIWDSTTKSWASNIMFVSEYLDGSTPYGVWIWRTVAAMNDWTQNQDYNYNVGIVLLATSNCCLWLFYKCTSGLRIIASIPQLPTFQGMGLPCSLAGGSAGGPWTQDGGYQTSVNGFTSATQSNVMFGLYFGDAVLSLWEKYQRL